jgi:small subunit ribosomal protein S8
MYTDPIADMLTRIRNAGRVGHVAVLMPNSKLKVQIARVLKEQGYLDAFEVLPGVGAGTLRMMLRYTNEKNKKHVITGIKRESRPGQRVYVGSQDLPVVLNGFGIAVISTSRGVMTSGEAKSAGVGGEVLCTVW